METAGARRRDALYYPYIHIRGDVAWLKATLICFPHIKRMVPRDFEVNDSDDVRPYTTALGARHEPLVGRVDLDDPSVAAAQTALGARLAEELERDERAITERFSRTATQTLMGSDSTFQIHREKFLEAATWRDPNAVILIAFLREHHLVWRPNEPNLGPGEWWGIHPDLGEAVMATVACTIASSMGLDIVTNEGSVHEALAIADADAVYDSVIARRQINQTPDAVETTDQLVQLVVLNYFDLDKLTVEDIASMSRDEDGLFDFKRAVASVTSELSEKTDNDARNADLKWAGERVVHEWEESRRGMSRTARDFFSPDIMDVSATFLSTTLGAGLGLATGNPEIAIIATAPGLVVTSLTRAIKVIARQRKVQANSPYRYLSKLVDLGAVFQRGAALAVARPPSRERPLPAAST